MRKLNHSNFNNGLTLKILKAFRFSLKFKRTIIIKNRKGAEILKVKYIRSIRKFVLVDLTNEVLKVPFMRRFAKNQNMLSFVSANVSFCKIGEIK